MENLISEKLLSFVKEILTYREVKQYGKRAKNRKKLNGTKTESNGLLIIATI